MPLFYPHFGNRPAALYRDLVHQIALQLLVMMNERTQGTIYDRCTVSRLTGTVAGNPTYGNEITGATHFKSLLLDGTGDLVNFGNATAMSFEYTSSFAVVALIRPTVGADDCIISKHTGTRGWEFSLSAGGNLIVQLTNANTTAEIVVTSDGTLTTDTVTMVGFSYSGTGAASGVTLYKDGAAYADTDTTDNLAAATIVTAGDLQIGGRASSGLFNGYIGPVAVFNGTKTAADFARWAFLAGVR